MIANEGKIKSTLILNVKNPKKGFYIVCLQRYICPPKLKYKENEKGEVIFLGVVGQVKSISINSIILFSIVIASNLFMHKSPLISKESIHFLIGGFCFIVALNYINVLGTKWNVQNQIKNRK